MDYWLSEAKNNADDATRMMLKIWCENESEEATVENLAYWLDSVGIDLNEVLKKSDD
jgi:hypothetical protein